MANTPVPEDNTNSASGVKSYDAPERKAPPLGRIITIAIIAIVVIFVLTRLF